jgi:hypothetical protein
MNEKLQKLCEKITKESQEYLIKRNLGCEGNLKEAISHYHIAKKYTRIDIGGSGRYMVVNDTGEIYGIKAYGVIHKGHFFGTLDTIEAYFWGDYRAIKL